MTIHVNIGEAKTRFSELVAAAVRGEEIVVSKAGAPQVRLVMVDTKASGEVERRADKRRAAIGMFGHLVENREIDVQKLKADNRWDEHYRVKFDDPD